MKVGKKSPVGHKETGKHVRLAKEVSSGLSAADRQSIC
jgi:hypothetical protein